MVAENERLSGGVGPEGAARVYGPDKRDARGRRRGSVIRSSVVTYFRFLALTRGLCGCRPGRKSSVVPKPGGVMPAARAGAVGQNLTSAPSTLV